MASWDYILYGKILPERVNWSFKVENVILSEPDFGYKYNVSLFVDLSIITVHVKSDNEIIELDSLRNFIRDYIRLFCDSYGYIKGYAYDLEITSIFDITNSKSTIFGVQIYELEQESSKRPIQKFGDMVNIMSNGQNNELRLSLNNLRLAIQHPTDTGMYCYRAIESLMQYFNNNDNDATWKMFRDNLNISKIFLKPIMDKSWPSRHGKPIPITHNERVDVMKRAWAVVDRFVIYAKSNHLPLDKIQYSEL